MPTNTYNQGHTFPLHFPKDSNMNSVAVIAGLTHLNGITQFNMGRVATDGRLIVDIDNTIDTFTATGSSAINETTSFNHDFMLDHVSIHFSALTSNGLTVTLNSRKGDVYDAVLYTETLNGASDVVWNPNGKMHFNEGDEINVKYTNSGAATYGLRVVSVQK